MVRLWGYCRQQFTVGRSWQVGAIMVGIIAGQCLLYGPCLIGRKVLLPLDSLAQRGVYIPRTEALTTITEQDNSQSDIAYLREPNRRFMVRELEAGRFPLWNPHQFAGVPYVAPRFSPFAIIECASESPVVIAWTELASALVAGLGAYYFCRRSLQLGYWPAAMIAWTYPLSGFLVLWQAHTLRPAVCWLPWLLVSVDRAIHSHGRWRLAGLALATAAVLTSGHIDVAGQVLLVSGGFSLWWLWDKFRGHWRSTAAFRIVLLLIVGWIGGFMLAAPHVLQLLEYTQTSYRATKRGSGAEERPPGGLAALPQLVFPDYYGRTTRGSVLTTPCKPGNLQESAAGAYAGVLALLVAAPLAAGSVRHRAVSLFLSGLSLLGVGWCLDAPIVVDIMRLPGLRMMSHNRLVFVTSFGVLVLAAIGLQALRDSEVGWKRWHWLPMLMLTGLAGVSFYRAFHLQEPIATQLEQLVLEGKPAVWLKDLRDVSQVKLWFVRHHFAAGILCTIGVAWWLVFKLRWLRARPLSVILTAALLLDLIWFAWGRAVQSDPALNYPPVPALEYIAQHGAGGRMLGLGCLPPNLATVAGLRDVRGYDGIDPEQMVALYALTAGPQSAELEYAYSATLVPAANISAAGDIILSPILDMLGVRYVVMREPPPEPAKPVFQQDDYYVLENKQALPRLQVVRRTETISDVRLRLARMATTDFDPRQVAIVEEALMLPSEARGTAIIENETPTRIQTHARMETEGLVVLADLWDRGWKAYRNGVETRILRVNHAVRGVVVPAGEWQIEFRYEPASFQLGIWLASFAAGGIVLSLMGRNQPRRAAPAAGSP